MNKTVLLVWNIISGIIALYVCYELIFQEEMTKTGRAAMALFFLSLLVKEYFNRKAAGNSK